MSQTWREYDPYTGVTTINVANDDDDLVTVHTMQDVQPILDSMAEARNTNATDKGIKKDLWFYCTIPKTVQYEMLKKGINIFNKDHTKKVLDEINANYPKLKTTTKTHALGGRPFSRKLPVSPIEASLTELGQSATGSSKKILTT